MKFDIIIDKDRCKGCVLCIASCPQAVLRMSRRLNARGYHYAEAVRLAKCIGCQQCVLICPDAAIEMDRIDDAKPAGSKRPAARRPAKTPVRRRHRR